MAKKKYVAYVGSYTYTGKAKGITIFDVDVEKGLFKRREEIEVANPSDIMTTHDRKILYSIADEGVISFRIKEDGSLEKMNTRKINGMRGHHLSVDYSDRFLFVSGYHDGKLTVVRLREDGSLGPVIDGVFHKGLGSIAERGSRPHVTCSKATPDGRFVLAADPGIDQVDIYRFNGKPGELKLVDAIRPERGSAPTWFSFSRDNRFLYLMYDYSNKIDVFRYTVAENGMPEFEKIQSVCSTGNNKPGILSAAMCLAFTKDDKHVFCGSAGDNSVTMFNRDAETGLLDPQFNLPISGELPKEVVPFPDGKHLVSVNHESGTLTFFSINYEKKLLIMSSTELKVSQPNCCLIVPIGG